MPEPKLLLVHAHPDDETIATGGTMARYAAEGVQVTLVTCTRGEEGEIVAEDLREVGTGKALGDLRTDELAAAMRVLGVTDHRFLGPYEDSGMMGTPPNEKAPAFWNADLEEAAAHLIRIVDEVQPHVVVTYDEHGGYGHPDHIQAHRVTRLALAGATWRVPKLYYPVMPSRLVETPPTAAIDIASHLERKLIALAEHRTQVTVDADGKRFALADGEWHDVFADEYYLLAAGDAGPAAGPQGRETDLFAGIIAS